jgi:hypothetical protein
LPHGKSQAKPQLDESFRGTGVMRAASPAARQARSNKSAMLVVLNVARQDIYLPAINRLCRPSGHDIF